MLVAVHDANNRFSIAVQPIDGDTRKTIVEYGFEPTYLPSGHLVFGRGSTILAAAFDATRLEVSGPPVALVERVDNEPPSGISQYRLSSSGALAYIPQRPHTGRTLTWMTSDGKATPIAVPAGAFDAAARLAGRHADRVRAGTGGWRASDLDSCVCVGTSRAGDARRRPLGADLDEGRGRIGLRQGQRVRVGSRPSPAERRGCDTGPKHEPINPCRVDARFADAAPHRGSRQPTISSSRSSTCEGRARSRSYRSRAAISSRREPLARWPMDRVRRSPGEHHPCFRPEFPAVRNTAAGQRRGRPRGAVEPGRSNTVLQIMVAEYPPCRSTRHAGSPGARLACSSRGTSFRRCSIMMPPLMGGFGADRE